jgi:hypothetical protein
LLGDFLLAQISFTTSVTIVTSHVMGINSITPMGADLHCFFFNELRDRLITFPIFVR